jgi:D-glycero-D-manno-heptose 1,7-bisphosphate phosphatase
VAERRLLLLDRDGTVLLAPPHTYVLAAEDVILHERAAETIAHATCHNFVPVLVTNQSCVARGLTTQDWVDEVNAWIGAAVHRAGGGPLLALSCPHVDADGCACRKPKSAMLHDAARLTDLELTTAWSVGDSGNDLDAARAAGVGRFLHVCPPSNSSVCREPDVECLPRFRDLVTFIDAAR